MTGTMRAAFYDRNGEPGEVITIGEVPIPEPSAGEVRVRVHASGVNPSDVKRVTGWAGGRMEHPRIVPHNDGAGVVDRIGTGVEPALLGQRVWVYEAARDGRAFGTSAEYVVVPRANVVALPEGCGFDLGACLGVPAMTAHRCVFADGSVAGQTVLVAGGAGAVGRFAVQFAKWGGARVIATVGSPAKGEIARQAGADHVVEYHRPNLANSVMDAARATPSGGVDRIVEVAPGPNFSVDLEVLKTNGTLAIYAFSEDADEELSFPMRKLLAKGAVLRWILVYSMPEAAKSQAVRDITQAVRDGALTSGVTVSYPLASVAEAYAAVGIGGAGGRVLIQPI
ncbi:NADPH:quinone reductase [Roseomonas sp. BN140053]|uniref:NADPH:quinone reductase n=1 Tax=Roseomonas sp. BN140053 TaxID=3391898 RepID=UPI0039E9F5EF